MPALFAYEMALAAVDPWKLRADGTSNWSVHCFDRLGRWTASATGMTKAEAKKKAAKYRRRARKEMAEKDSTRLTGEAVNSGSCNDGELHAKREQS